MELSSVSVAVILQNVVKTNRTKIQILEQENDDLRTVHQNYDDTHSEFDDSKY